MGTDARVVIYHLDGRTVEAGEHDLLLGLDPQATISAVRLTDADANYLSVAIRDVVTRINDIDALPTDADVFDLSGRRIGSFDAAPSGTYIIKRGNKQFKIRK